jgi:predicted nucleic acid-binding protein
MTESNKIFIDSNIWLYRLLVDPTTNPVEHDRKRQIAIALTQVSNQNIVVSTQVITETCSVLKRKAQLLGAEILGLITEFEEQCEIINLTTIEIKYACQLRSSAASQLEIRVGKSEEISEFGYSKRKLNAEEVHCSINRSRTE